MDAPLDASNRGFRLLLKMGWRGRGLGKQEQGIVEPVRMKENLVTLGLGKAEEYDQVTQQATSERRRLETELQMNESEQQLQQRSERVARELQLRQQVQDMRSAFYCSDCRKQYRTVSEMDSHLSSYDHHHTKRLRELQKKRPAAQHEQDAKRRKEQQHEELLLQRRIAAQAQVVQAEETKQGVAKSDASKQQPTAAKVGFSFEGGMRLSAKKTKKTLAVPTAFGTPFSRK